jgi:transcriptional regulator with XRE-family HTH domain
MAIDQGPVVMSALLRGELVRLRREQDLTQEQVASELEWSASKLIRVEGGRSSITKVDLDALLDKYGVTSKDQRDRLQALNRGAREHGYWDAFRDRANPTLLVYLGYEVGASVIRQYGNTIPGLLQTRQFAEQITAATVDDPVRITYVVNLRVARQAALARRDPAPRRMFILDEAAVRRHVGIRKDPMIMPDQLRHIAAAARADERLTVQIIPFSAGEHAGIPGAFTLLEFEGGLQDTVYLDGGQTFLMASGEDPRVSEYADRFDKLRGAALPPTESIEFLLAAAEEMS